MFRFLPARDWDQESELQPTLLEASNLRVWNHQPFSLHSRLQRHCPLSCAFCSANSSIKTSELIAGQQWGVHKVCNSKGCISWELGWFHSFYPMILYILGSYSWVEPESTMAPHKCWGLKTDAALICGMHCGTSFLGVFESSSRKIQGPNDHGLFLHFQNPQKHPTFSHKLSS